MPGFSLSRGILAWPVGVGPSEGFFGLTFRRSAGLTSAASQRLEETVMDATVGEIGEVVVAELRSAGYLASTIGQYEKTIRALAVFVED